MEDLSAGIGSFLQLPALFQESHHGRLLGSWNLGADPCVQLDPPIRHSTSAGRTDLRLRQLRPGLGLRSLDGVEQDPTAADRRSDPPQRPVESEGVPHSVVVHFRASRGQ